MNCFHIENLYPIFLAETSVRESEVWRANLTFEAPETAIVWGPSGSGKSTLLRILYGLEQRYEGELRIDGRMPSKDRHQFWPGLRQKHLALVAQDFGLFENVTGWENLLLSPTLHSDADKPQILRWASHLGIGQLLERPPSTWSFGQRQRFALLRALCSPFKWLLLDEPFSHLDPESALRCMNLLESVCAERNAGWILAQQTPDTNREVDHILKV